MSKKLVAFDLEGTLVDMPRPSSWQTIGDDLGCIEERRKLWFMYSSGEIDYAEWSRRTVDLYSSYGLTKNRLLDIFEKKARLMNGAHQTLLSLQDNGMKTAIISGGIKNLYDHLFENNGIKVDDVNIGSEILFGSDGKITGGIYNQTDFEGKAETLKNICSKYGFSLDECVFVGNGSNDKHVFQISYGIGFMPEKELEKYAKVIIREKDMRKILDFVV